MSQGDKGVMKNNKLFTFHNNTSPSPSSTEEGRNKVDFNLCHSRPVINVG